MSESGRYSPNKDPPPYRTIIIPEGLLDPNETGVIEIPRDIGPSQTLIAKPKTSLISCGTRSPNQSYHSLVAKPSRSAHNIAGLRGYGNVLTSEVYRGDDETINRDISEKFGLHSNRSNRDLLDESISETQFPQLQPDPKPYNYAPQHQQRLQPQQQQELYPLPDPKPYNYTYQPQQKLQPQQQELYPAQYQESNAASSNPPRSLMKQPPYNQFAFPNARIDEIYPPLNQSNYPPNLAQPSASSTQDRRELTDSDERPYPRSFTPSAPSPDLVFEDVPLNHPYYDQPRRKSTDSDGRPYPRSHSPNAYDYGPSNLNKHEQAPVRQPIPDQAPITDSAKPQDDTKKMSCGCSKPDNDFNEAHNKARIGDTSPVVRPQVDFNSGGTVGEVPKTNNANRMERQTMTSLTHIPPVVRCNDPCDVSDKSTISSGSTDSSGSNLDKEIATVKQLRKLLAEEIDKIMTCAKDRSK